MNTSEVAKLLGVSKSTIKRWVRQLELPLERSDRGHYIFKQEDIDLLQKVQEQINQGILIQDALSSKDKKRRIGVIMTQNTEQTKGKLETRVEDLERKLSKKADEVVTYQILQHRREIEDLQSQVDLLTDRLEKLERNLGDSIEVRLEEPIIIDKGTPLSKRKKKNLMSSFFGFS